MYKQPKPQTAERTPASPLPYPTESIGPVEDVASPACIVGDDLVDREKSTLPHCTATQTFAQTFGLDYRAAILTLLVDLMVFGGDTLSLGMLIPVGVLVAGVLCFIVYRVQTRWYEDDHDSALIKCLVVGLLTAIPVPLGPLIAVPSGIVGIIKAARRR